MGPVKAFGQHSFERAVRAAGVTAPAVWADVTGSTNDIARKLAEDGAPEWTVVGAGHQTAGRGRLGRSWTDVSGKALLCSIVLRPSLAVEEAPLLTLLAAAAMIDAVGVPRLRSKWPNDLVAGGRKVGGILAEAAVAGGTVGHLVLGVGLNVAIDDAEFPEDVRGQAASLDSLGLPAEPEALLTSFLGKLTARYPTVRARAVEDYRLMCETLGRAVRGRSTDGETVRGTAIDLDRLGGLIVRTDAGLRTIAFGEIDHLR
jgi:BirA family transcriptional regulator, biotin operon repressor / biotin---[acetyl-CoA-carboxylase] ligase